MRRTPVVNSRSTMYRRALWTGTHLLWPKVAGASSPVSSGKQGVDEDLVFAEHLHQPVGDRRPPAAAWPLSAMTECIMCRRRIRRAWSCIQPA